MKLKIVVAIPANVIYVKVHSVQLQVAQKINDMQKLGKQPKFRLGHNVFKKSMIYDCNFY